MSEYGFCGEQAYGYLSSVQTATKRCEIAGSYRRGAISTHDVDIVCADSEIPPFIEKIEREIRPLISVTCVLDVHSANPEHFGPMMLTWTGPSGANIGMRRMAAEKGMKLNQYGLFDRRTSERLDNNTEDDICMKILGRKCKRPEDR